LLRHAFESLSPEGQILAKAIARTLPFWLPGTMIALAAGVAGWRRQRRRDEGQASGAVASMASLDQAG
jgi:hypothetical protein